MAPVTRGDKRAFFDVSINGEPAGRIVFALWNFSCPSTVENFRSLCTGELGELYGHPATYQGSIFHRVVKGFMIQGGDITHKNGQGGFSIYGRQFDDENLSLKHNKPYLLSMANRGPDTNGSQFFITTQETPHLDGKHVVFGEVVKGIELVKRIENLEVDEEDKPLDKVQVVYSGEMVKKGGAVDKMKDQMEETKEKEPSGVKMDDEPKTNNWLMRRSRSPEDRKKRDSEDRRHRRRDNQRREKRRSRSRSRRSRSPREHERRDRKRPTITTKDGVKIKGRGKVTFLGNRNRSATPPHWRREESKKHTLEEHRKRQEELEERDKRRAQRDKEYEERRALREKEQKEEEARRELDRQRREAEEELERQNAAAADTVKEEFESSESSKDPSESSDSSDSDSSDSD